MISAWRLVKERHAAAAFSGEGARLTGGRWNREGVPAVYLSEHLSLAALELYVHLTRRALGIGFAAIKVTFPESVSITEIAPTLLPEGWRREPAPDVTKELGTEWIVRGETAVLKVPSALVPQECNYVLNPAHPEFKELIKQRSRPEPFTFDARMLQA